MMTVATTMTTMVIMLDLLEPFVKFPDDLCGVSIPFAVQDQTMFYV